MINTLEMFDDINAGTTTLIPNTQPPVPPTKKQIKDLIDNIFKHSLSQPRLKPLLDFTLQFAIVFFSFVGSWNYVAPATDYVKEDGELVLSQNPIHSIIGVIELSALILMNATQIFLRWSREENVPNEIRHYFRKKTKWQSLLENAVVFIGSAASAVPLVSTYTIYGKEPLPIKIPVAIMIQWINTWMHFLPYKLMLKSPVYGAPFWLTWKAVSFTYRKLFQDKKSIDEITREKKLSQVVLLLNRLADRIAELTAEEVDNSLHKTSLFNYTVVLSKTIDQLTEEEDPASLSDLLFPIKNPDEALIENLPIIENSSQPWWKAPSQILGAFTMSAGCFSFSVNPFKMLDKLLGNLTYACLLAFLPSYAYTVLLAYFGENMGHDTARAIATVSHGKNPFSVEAKLFSAFFFIMFASSVYYGLFSAPAALQVNKDNLDFVSDKGLVFFNWASIISLFVLSIFCGKDAHIWVSQKYVNYWGTEEQKNLNNFREASTMTTERIRRIDPQQALEMFQDPHNHQFLESVGISQKEINQTLSTDTQQKTSYFSRLSGFWTKTARSSILNRNEKQEEEESTLLLLN